MPRPEVFSIGKNVAGVGQDLASAAIAASRRVIGLLEPWQAINTFQNGWSNYGSGVVDAKCRRDQDGVIHLRGVVRNMNNPGSDTAFYLPLRHRPLTGVAVPAVCSATLPTYVGGYITWLAFVVISPDGSVLIPHLDGGGAQRNYNWIILNDITFWAADA